MNSVNIPPSLGTLSNSNKRITLSTAQFISIVKLQSRPKTKVAIRSISWILFCQWWHQWGRRLEGWPNTAAHLADRPYRFPRSGAAQLRASGNSSCFCCYSIIVWTDRSNLHDMEITHGVPRHFSSNTFHLLHGWTWHIVATMDERAWEPLAGV